MALTKVEEDIVQAARKISNTIVREPIDVGEDAPNRNDFSIFSRTVSRDIDELMKLCRKDKKANRALGSMVGMAVGDSVGAPLEFLPVGKTGSWFDPRSLKVVGEYNKFDLKPGQWTDDTAMGLCLADSVLVLGGYNGSDIRVRFWNWWNRGYNNAFRKDNTRSKSVGLGENIRASLFEIRNSNPPPRFEVDGAEDSGNGSLMRLAPVPIFFHKDVMLSMQVAAESSFTTHPGPIAADACAFLAFLIVKAVTRDSNSKELVKEFLDAQVKAYLELPEAEGQPVLLQLLRANEASGSTERCWNWRDPSGPFIKETLEARGRSYNGYPVSEGYFGAYSMDGLAIALHCFYHTKSFSEAVTKCVNFLGDADSTGAICGQIAGAFYGYDAINSKLIDRIRQWDSGEIALRGAVLYGLGMGLSGAQQDRARQATDGALLPAEERRKRRTVEDAENARRATEEDKRRADDLQERERRRKEVEESINPLMMDDGMSNAAALAAYSESAAAGAPVLASEVKPKAEPGPKAKPKATPPPITAPVLPPDTPQSAVQQPSPAPKAKAKAAPKAAEALPQPPDKGQTVVQQPSPAPKARAQAAPKAAEVLKAAPKKVAAQPKAAGPGGADLMADAYPKPPPVPALPPLELQGLPDLPTVLDMPFAPPLSSHPVGGLSKIATDVPKLPAGWQVGDRVYYCGGKQAFRNGNRLFFALRGKVVGAATPQSDKRLNVFFDENATSMDVAMCQLSRMIPVIPGGFAPGDRVYYCGEAQEFFNGDRLTFGMIGQVVGRSTANDGKDDKRVKVLLDGNRTAISVFLTQVSKHSPVIPGGLKPGDRVFYCGAQNQVFGNGDKLRFGMTGEVSGRSTVGDGDDQKKVKVRLDGNKGPVTVLFSEVAKPMTEEERLRTAADEVQKIYDNEEEQRREAEQKAYLARLEAEEKRFQEEARRRRQQEEKENFRRVEEEKVRQNIESERKKWLASAEEVKKRREEAERKLTEELHERARLIAQHKAYQEHLKQEEAKPKTVDGKPSKRGSGPQKQDENSWLLSLTSVPDEPMSPAKKVLAVPPMSSHPGLLSSISRDVVQLPGQWTVDDELFFCAPLRILDDSARLMFGTPGTAVSVGPGGPDSDAELVCRFNGIPTPVEVGLWQVCREPPSLPMGYSAGDRVYYAGGKQSFASGNRLSFSLPGEVVGPSTPPDGKRLKVWFDGNETPIDVVITQILTSKPVIPGGYQVGDRVYYTGEQQTFPDGDRLAFGLAGEVVGRSTAGNAADERRLKVIFDGNRIAISVFLTQVSREPPVLPGGYEVGDKVQYTANKKQRFGNGDQLYTGLNGEIAGKSTMGDGSDDRRIKVKFDGNQGPVNVFLDEISMPPEEAARKEAKKQKNVEEKPKKPGTRRAKSSEDVKANESKPKQADDAKKVEEPRKQAAPAANGESIDDVQPDNFESYSKKLAKLLSRGHDEINTAVCTFMGKAGREPKLDAPVRSTFSPFDFKAQGSETELERISVDISVQKTGGMYQVSHKSSSSRVKASSGSAAPSAAASAAPSATPSAAPSNASENAKLVALPGGYEVGEKVYYNGGQQEFPSGNRLAFALSGDVVGHATPPDERRLKIKFVGNVSPMDVIYTQISREVPVIPGGWQVGDRIYFNGDAQTFSNGDRLSFGLPGEIVGRSTFGDGNDEKRVKVLIDGNKGSCTVFLTQVSKEMPVLPGKYVPGDRVVYNAKKRQLFKNGDKLVEGMAGAIVGRSTMGDTSDARRIKVKFDDNAGPINVFVSEIILENANVTPREALAKGAPKDDSQSDVGGGSRIDFIVGDRCEALYEDEWYEGTILAPPEDDKDKLGRWTVQCDCDEDGLVTFAAEIRRVL